MYDRGKNRDGQGLIIFGPMSVTGELPLMTAKEVYSRVREVIDICDGNAHLALFTANTINPDVPLQNIRAMHEANLDRIKRLLAAYLTGWMGGPPVYQAMTGTVCLTEPHAAYAIGPEERDQWLLCMDAALDRIGASDEVRTMLREPLFRIADTVRNQDHSGRQPEPAPNPNIIARG